METKLKHFDIEGNAIGDDGVRLIIEGLLCNNTLTKLDARNCDFLVKGNWVASVVTTLNISTTYT